jgi:transcriptional regulator with XRE-family HTH domain
VVRQPRTIEPISQWLPRLVAENGTSLRQLAREIKVSQSYLSRIKLDREHEDWRPPSKAVLERLAQELGVPASYFPEFRAIAIEEAIAADGALRDRLFDQLQRIKP